MKNIELLIEKTKRSFNVEDYVNEKIKVINNFFITENLDTAVVGISGGIDSAVVYRLLQTAMGRINSPIKIVQAMILPIIGSGTTTQDEAVKLASLLLLDNEKDKHIYNLSFAYNQYVKAIGYDGTKPTSFANGQLASIVRTPMLYYKAACLQDEGYKSIVVGTTNMDEGSYIGFFGKASDAMVDLQLIADLHKSEVYEVAKYLKIPNEIIENQPRGDVYDGRTDFEMIGAPYWMIELYTEIMFNIKSNSIITYSDKVGIFLHYVKEYININLTEDEINLLSDFIKNIEKIHSHNKHKYKVGSPARYINILPTFRFEA